VKRHIPFGALVQENGVDFRVWAPACQTLELLLEGTSYPLKRDHDGCFSLFVKEAKPGMRYLYRLDGKKEMADPASFYQPEGIKGPSEIVDLKWTESWKGLSGMQDQVLYELHVGTFTKDGTWRSAIEKLPHLVDLGITVIEMMPIHQFNGDFGWGYDGIFLFAPHNSYGTPDDLRAFIQAAHRLGLAVILDVVYNHFGPDIECHKIFSSEYFAKEWETDWGMPLNYDSPFVRDFVISNAAYWIEAFHFDGLRLDATQNIYDFKSKTHIFKEIVDAANRKRKTVVIGENESQDRHLLADHALNGLWDDDFHHTMRVALTGTKEAYYHDYNGTPNEILACIKYGYLYQGQYYEWQSRNRGTPVLDMTPDRFVFYLENHDQIANATRAQRLPALSQPALLRALTTVFLLAPQTPLLFQGQEWHASSPFAFFAEHDPFFHESVLNGRIEFTNQFNSAHSLKRDDYPNPASKETFLACKLKWEEMEKAPHQAAYHLYKTLLALRKKDPTLSQPHHLDGSVCGNLLLIRYFGKGNDDRLVICNMGKDLQVSSLADPLFAPPLDKKWELLFSSNDIGYGGNGTPAWGSPFWDMPAYTTYVLSA
jgi:maltooligosyltrehalose trehalohydrolase